LATPGGSASPLRILALYSCLKAGGKTQSRVFLLVEERGKKHRRRMLSHRSNMKPGNELTSLVRMIPGGVKSREQKNPQQKHIVLTNSSIFT
jgi:hypothetical protein